MAITLTTHQHHEDRSFTVAARVSEDEKMVRNLTEEIFSRIATAVADRYVEEHYVEIAARLDQNAVANLAIADAGKKIAEEIRSKPTVLRERTTNNKYSIF